MLTNFVSFSGFAGRDAETRAAGQSQVANFSLCHTHKQQGRKDEVTWVNVVVFGGWCSTASAIKKGDNVTVTGRLRINQWEDKQGNQRQSTEIVAFSLGIIRKDEQPRDTQRSGKSSPRAENPPNDQW